MNCWHCKQELIWGGDQDIDEESESFSVCTNLSCPDCGSFVEVYYPKENPEMSVDTTQVYGGSK